MGPRSARRVADVLRQNGPVADPERFAELIQEVYGANTDGAWLATQLARHGAEPLWRWELLERRHALDQWSGPFRASPIRAILATTAQGRSVEALYIPGASPERLLVVAGVHGSEQGGIEVVEMLLASLERGPRPMRTVMVVPVLFPDNAATRTREDPTHPTNRNFPPLGEGLNEEGKDALGRPVLPENQALIALLDRFAPRRVITVHGTTRRPAAGVFSDPYTVGSDAGAAELDEAQRRTDEDRRLAIATARAIAEAGEPQAVLGNQLNGTPTAGWSGGVANGVSLGGWGPRAVAGGRPAVGVITVEVPENYRSDDRTGKARRVRRAELRAFRDAVLAVLING